MRGDDIIINLVHFLHVEKLVTMRVLIICTDRPILLNHLPVVLIDVLGTRKGQVWILHLVFSLFQGLLVRVQLEVCNQVMYRVDLFTVVHDWRDFSLHPLS